jgi:small nuclear ribonucleoprotein (snRNP)-like protein
MSDMKQGIPINKIQDCLGSEMIVDLKNHHKIIGNMAFFHFTEQMIHMSDWTEYDEKNTIVRKGAYMVINRTAWFQLYTYDKD